MLNRKFDGVIKVCASPEKMTMKPGFLLQLLRYIKNFIGLVQLIMLKPGIVMNWLEDYNCSR